ncbi:cytochrome P450, partial [Ralstonia pseudosolanacearum]|uniref:cytochrome P450 n=1 Tax=Ralstonia pseudosolanacearum TaxID=1310165 RepID=UPI003CF0FEC8
FLKWWDLGGHIKEMKNTIKQLDSVFKVWYEEHQKKRSVSAKGDEDFMDVSMSISEREKISDYDDETLIKATCLSIFSGSDTSMLTLTWMLALMLGNDGTLKKVRDELDEHVGTDRIVDETDVKNLVYLQAVIKEALRLYPAGPLGAPRVAIEDCTLAGYHIPAGTRLAVNLSKIQRDPLVWSNPSEFHPERFLTTR